MQESNLVYNPFHKNTLDHIRRLTAFAKAAEQLVAAKEILSSIHNKEIIRQQHIRDYTLDSYFICGINEHAIEYKAERYAKLIATITVKTINKKLESLSLKINRLNALISKLKTKFLQLQKLNKRKIFRSKVNLIFKNLDDCHLKFDLFSFNKSTKILENNNQAIWKPISNLKLC